MSSSSSSSSVTNGSSMVSSVARYSLFSSSSQTTSIKLDKGNYLVWESVVLPLIEGNRLEGHINGLESAQPRFITENDSSVPNPAYDEWYAVDRLLVGWLRNTMTQDVGAQLLSHRTAVDLWCGARDLTSASTKARIMVFKSELQNTRKNTMKMEEYLTKMKAVADQLALAGAPVSDDDLIL